MFRILCVKFTMVLCLLAVLNDGIAQQTFADKQMEVVLRMTGHKLLLSNGDSTSRVLPIVSRDGRYQIEFEKQLEIDPDKLVTIVRESMETAGLFQPYILEVQECASGDVAYSFKVDYLQSNNIIPCKSRVLPSSCYRLAVTFSDNTTASTDQTAETTSFSGQGRSRLMLILAFPLSVIVVALSLVIWKNKNGSDAHPAVIRIGKFHFDQLNSVLILEEQKTELTAKEAELLLILYNSANSTVERDLILQEVWGDEGDYIGRTLDVFISKLRKKLEADPGVRIVNVRGVGYKLIKS